MIRLLSITLALAGCGGAATRFATRYTPLHPANGAPVTVTVEAGDDDGIARAELYVYQYALDAAAPSQSVFGGTRTSAGAWGLVASRDYADRPPHVKEAWPIGKFPAASAVSIIAQITDGRGAVSNEKWTFAAGDWPYPNVPIPLWVDGDPARHVDVGFAHEFDSSYYVSARAMLPDLEALIFDGFLSANAIALHRNAWQFYYSDTPGTVGDPGTETNLPDVFALNGVRYGAVIHRADKPDWTDGNKFSSEPYHPGTAVHEAGHAVFGLADEYGPSGRHEPITPFGNNFATLSQCHSYNAAHGWPAGDCEAIEGTPWFRPERHDLGCIMFDDGNTKVPDFGSSCLQRAEWFHHQLESSP
jgi:hypothetical protein